MNEIIYLESDEDVASVIGRVKESQSRAVSLVVPRGGTIAQSVVNLKLLKREIENSGKAVSMVTDDKISKNLASQVGVTVYPSVSQARAATPIDPATVAGSGQKDPQNLQIHRYDKEDDLNNQPIQDDQLEPKEPINQPKVEAEKSKSDFKQISHNGNYNPKKARERISDRRKQASISKKKPILIVGGVGLVIVLALSYIFLPNATASVILETADHESNYEVTVDKSTVESNLDQLILPGEEVVIEKELTKEFVASGRKNIGTKASGEITFYNYWDINPQVLSAGTILVASGKNYVLKSDITIPGALVTLSEGVTKKSPGTAKVRVIAALPGEEYNVSPARFLVASFSGNKQAEIYGESSSDLTGGTSKEVTIVSGDDLEKAKGSLKSELLSHVNELLEQQKIDNDWVVLDSGRKDKEVSFESTKKAEDEASSFTASLKVESTSVVFLESGFRDIIVKKIESELGEDVMVVNPEKSELAYDVVSADLDEGVIIINGKLLGKTGKRFEERVIKSEIKNLKSGSAETKIEEMDGVREATLSVWPSFLAKVPFLESRIEVKFDYEE